MKKKQKKEKAEAEEKAKGPIGPAKPEIEDEGIFDDVDGEYVPSVIATKKGIKAYSSFVNTLEPVVNPLDQINEAREKAINQYKNEIQQAPQQQKDDREKETSFVSDVYAECYPGTYEGLHNTLIESDEEDDLTRIDSRNRLKKWDFEPENNDDYDSNAVPKSAFQFGVKSKDGRKNKKQSEQKLKNQLKQLEGLYEQKTGKKFVADQENFDQDEPDPNSYEHKLNQKRYRSNTSEEIQIMNKRPRLQEPMTPTRTFEPRTPNSRAIEPRTPGSIREPLTPGGSTLNSKLFK